MYEDGMLKKMLCSLCLSTKLLCLKNVFPNRMSKTRKHRLIWTDPKDVREILANWTSSRRLWS